VIDDNVHNGEFLIRVNNLFKDFGKVKVLKGVSCDIKKGEKVVVIGPSGSGKSTMLRCMNLLETPTYGEIWFNGKLLTPVDPYLHFDVIRESDTYKCLMINAHKDFPAVSPAELDLKVIEQIKKEDLLRKREGKNYSRAIKQIFEKNYQDVNLTRRKMGMVFQHLIYLII